ncbi:MAG TPA: FHA domain-containing protein [Myxococcus sp.]|nr:FHA domain-containing protein [Myxococcus sp.]
MAPPNPKRPPRPPRPPGTQAPKDSDVELPFDDDEVDPLQADDPRPQRVPQFPAGSRRSRRRADGERASADRELVAPRFDLSREYTDPGHPPAFLYVERGPGAGQLVPVKQGSLVLGRSSSADLRLQHPSISRRHAQLHRRGDRFFLKDLSSQNGTFLNRARVTAEVELKPGDEISMGSALLRLRGPGGGTPALGIPAIITDTEVPYPRRWRPGTFNAALIAALVGSGLAALVSLIAIYLSGDLSSVEEVPPPPPVEVAPKGPATPPPPGEASPKSTGASGQGSAPGGVVVVSGKDSAASPATEGAPPAPAASASGQEPTASPVTGAVEQNSAAPESPPAATGGEAAEPAPPPATGAGVRTGGAAGPSALDVARGAAKARSGPVSKAEAEVLRRYVAGDVAKARDKARAAKLSTLSAQLTRFAQAEAEARKAQAKGDVARATVQLTTAVAVDEALAPDGSRHGPALRKRLSGLLVQTGLGHVKAGREDAARETFEEALEYDAGNRQALEQLNRLRAAAAPSPAAPR